MSLLGKSRKLRTMEFDRMAYVKNTDEMSGCDSSSDIVNRRMAVPLMNEKTKADLRKSMTFKRIEKDIRMKKRQKEADIRSGTKKDLSETYVDKDRAIAVVIGTEDLKGHVMRLRGEKNRSSKNEMEAAGLQILQAQAAHELRYGEARKSLAYLERGMGYKNDNIDCLLLRSRIYLELSRHSDALNDVNSILKNLRDPDNPQISKALTLKADALYNMGDFEHALLNYYRALKNANSREKDDLRLKIIRTEIGITNSVGSNAGRYFRHLDHFLVEVQEDMLLPWNMLKDLANPYGGERKRDSLTDDKKFLNQLAYDKRHLERLLHKLTEQKDTPTKFHGSIQKQAEEALNFLIERRDFWAQQNPDYPPKLDEEVIPVWQNLFQKILNRNKFVKMIESLKRTDLD